MFTEPMLSRSQVAAEYPRLDSFSAVTGRAITLRNMTLSARIKMAREAAGLSQSALARAIKVNASAVNHMESGRTKALRAETILALASALSVSAYWLETGNGSPSPDARLSPEESEALSLYRLLTPANRDAFLSVGRTLLSAQPATRASTAHPFQTAKRVR